jgi:hypothetical protein
VRTVPVVPLQFGGAEVAQPFALPMGSADPLVIGYGRTGSPISARIRLSRTGPAQVTLRIESDRPLGVRYGATEHATPTALVLPTTRRAPILVLEDPGGARLQVRLQWSADE